MNSHPRCVTGRFSTGKAFICGAACVLLLLLCMPERGLAQQVNSFTNFEGLTVGASVNGQAGWKATGAFDEAVTSDGLNTVWRVSNAITSGAFGNQPFAPCPGGDPPNTTLNAGAFAGETSTGAATSRFYAEFNFKSATGGTQNGLRITSSADDCQGARQSYLSIEDNGKNGLDVFTFNVNKAGVFGGAVTIAKALSYSQWHTVAVELIFRDGVNNDIARLYVDGQSVFENNSWEDYYRNFQALLHPNGVPAQTLLFRMSGDAAPALSGGGLFIDNVLTQVSYAVRPVAIPGK